MSKNKNKRKSKRPKKNKKSPEDFKSLNGEKMSDFIKLIKEHKDISSEEATTIRIYPIVILGLGLILIIILGISKEYKIIDYIFIKNDNLLSSTFYFTSLTIYAFVSLKLLIVQNLKKYKEHWPIPRLYRTLSVGLLFGSLFYLLSIFTSDTGLNNLTAHKILMILQIPWFIGSSILLLIYRYPKLIFNRLITGFGSLCVTVSNLLIGALFLIWTIPLKYSNYYLLLYLLLFVIYKIWISKRKINFIEEQAAKYTKTDKLLFAIEGRKNLYKYEIEALKEIHKRKKAGEIGYLYKLNELIIQKYAKKENKFLAILKYVLVVLIFESLTEGLVQDLFLDPIKNILCNLLNLFC